MNPSAEKRKMSRMQVDLSACIVWGVANNRSDVKIQDMSIHGISFRVHKVFHQRHAVQFDPSQSKERTGDK